MTVYYRHRPRMSSADDEIILQGNRAGEDPKEIARKLHRSAQGVWARGKLLGLVWKRKATTQKPAPIRDVLPLGVNAERDHAYVGQVVDMGGFPRATTTEYDGKLIALWVRPDGLLWRPTA